MPLSLHGTYDDILRVLSDHCESHVLLQDRRFQSQFRTAVYLPLSLIHIYNSGLFSKNCAHFSNHWISSRASEKAILAFFCSSIRCFSSSFFSACTLCTGISGRILRIWSSSASTCSSLLKIHCFSSPDVYKRQGSRRSLTI